MKVIRYWCAVFAAILILSLSGTGSHAGSPALWRLADSDSEIWIFGTVHMLPRGLSWRTPAFDSAFAAAETVYLEVDLRPSNRHALGALTRELGQNANFITLSSLLGPEDTERLAHAAERLGVPPENFETMRPWFASVTLSILQFAALGFDPTTGVDTVITDLATVNGKQLGFFESVEDQMKLFASLSPATEKAYLVATLDHIEQQGLTGLVEAWSNGDMNALARILNRDEDPTELRDAIFVRRNQAWARKIAELMAGSGKIFIAVGAGHLTGRENLIALLRAREFTVKRL